MSPVPPLVPVSVWPDSVTSVSLQLIPSITIAKTGCVVGLLFQPGHTLLIQEITDFQPAHQPKAGKRGYILLWQSSILKMMLFGYLSRFSEHFSGKNPHQKQS
jgi:hypothetical protein